MNRYIPDPTSFLIFEGNNRGPQSDAGTFKSQQTSDGNGKSKCAPGRSTIVGIGISRLGSVGNCDASQTPLGGHKDRQIHLDTTATNGLLPFAPPIQTSVTISEGPNGAKSVNAWGTPYPSMELWQYGGPNGPTLIYHHEAHGSPLGLYSPGPLQ